MASSEPLSATNPTAGKVTVNIGTRKSALAVVQAKIIHKLLSDAHPSLNFEICAQNTTGDNNKITPLHNFGTKALWTKELEVDLLEGKLDLVVHCLKDMPTQLPPKCVIGCIMNQADPRDCTVMKAGLPYKTLAELPAGSIVGTSSVRRIAQGKRMYPDLVFKDVRGNIDTRLRKLDTEDYSCLILAAAGLLRMDMGHRITEYLDSSTPTGPWLYAVGQGVLAIELREGDDAILQLLAPLEEKKVMLQSLVERSLMRTLEGGCSIPIGVESAWTGEDLLQLKAYVGSVDGKEAVDVTETATVTTKEEAAAFGVTVAHMMVEKGAQKILDEINAGRDDGKKY